MSSRGAENRPPWDASTSLRTIGGEWVIEVREFLVVKSDGKVEHVPVLDGNVDQAKIRASLCQRPGDSLVAVKDDAYIRVQPEALPLPA
jgi:hypothetical protein